MGITYIEGVARGPRGKEETVRFLIDSGASYSLLPNPIWQAIELEPTREVTFTLADGSTVQRSVSECYLALLQGEGHTLEILGLVFNPFNRTLQPMRMLLM